MPSPTAGRVPDAPGWRQHAAGPDAVVLEHADPEAWMLDAPDDATLAQARADLEPILVTPERNDAWPDRARH